MERLTRRIISSGKADCAYCTGEYMTKRGCSNRCALRIAQKEKLAEYEDTGLTPDEIRARYMRKHACKIECLLDAYNKLSDEKKALETEIENRRAEPAGAGWVKCEDRMPDDDGYYLCYTGGKHSKFITMLRFEKEYEDENCEIINDAFWRQDSEWGGFAVDDITHWMPLPTPPERSDGDV